MKTVIRLQHVPPSLNNMYINVRGKGRVKSDRYRTWQQAVGWDIKKYHNQRWSEPVFLTIAVGKIRKNADLSNLIKPLEDLLVTHSIIADDSSEHVRGVNIYLASVPFDGVEIAITAADPIAHRRAA